MGRCVLLPTLDNLLGIMLMNPNNSIDTIKDCASLTVKLNRIASTYDVICDRLKHGHYLHIYSLVCGATSYDDFSKNPPDTLQPDYSKISEVVTHVLQKQFENSTPSQIAYSAKFISALIEELLRIATYVISSKDILKINTIIAKRDTLGLQKLEKENPYFFKFHNYRSFFKSTSKIEVVQADLKLKQTASHRRITHYIYEQVTDKKDYMSLLQLVFAHKYVPLFDQNYTAQVRVADWFNDADDEGQPIRQKTFHQAWTENFDPSIDLKFRFFFNDNANSFLKPITLYDTLTVNMNPSICKEYSEVN